MVLKHDSFSEDDQDKSEEEEEEMEEMRPQTPQTKDSVTKWVVCSGIPMIPLIGGTTWLPLSTSMRDLKI